MRPWRPTRSWPGRVTLMVDSADQLDFIDLPSARAPAADRRAGSGLHSTSTPRCGSPAAGSTWACGAPRCTRRRRSRSPGQASSRPEVRAGRADVLRGADRRPRRRTRPGRPLRGAAIRAMQRRSTPELAARRAAVVDAVRALAALEFVNGGGTGSVERPPARPSVTEVAAGSGLYGPTLFDAYRAWRPVPSAFFALSVVRTPGPRSRDRARRWLGRLRCGRARPAAQPGAAGRPQADRHRRRRRGPDAADRPGRGRPLRVGDRVWFRHAKAGELCEHVDELHLVAGDRRPPPCRRTAARGTRSPESNLGRTISGCRPDRGH